MAKVELLEGGDVRWTDDDGAVKLLEPDSPELKRMNPAQRSRVEAYLSKRKSSVVLREHVKREKGTLGLLISGLTNLAVEGAPAEVGAQVGRIGARVSKRIPEPVGEAVGGMAGETFRQLFMQPQGKGVDPMEILAAGGIAGPGRQPVQRIPGVAARTTTPGRLARIRTARAFVPGAGMALLEEAREEIDRIPVNLRRAADDLIQAEFPGQTAIGLRREALTLNPDISTPELRRAGAKLVGEELEAGRFGAEFGGRVRRLAKEIQGAGEGTLAELNIVRRNLGGLMQAAKDNSAQQDAISGLLAGLFRDVENAVIRGVPGAKQYMVSLEAFRRDMASLQLEGIISKTVRPIRGEDLHSLNITRLYDQVEKAFTAPSRGSRPTGLRLLPDVVGNREKAEILDLLRFWSENLPALPTRMGINAPNVGSGQILFRGGLGALGTIGLNQLAGAGIDPATAGLVTGTLSALVGNWIMSPRGREMLRGYIARGAPINVREMVLMTLAQGARARLFEGQALTEGLMSPFTGPKLEAPQPGR